MANEITVNAGFAAVKDSISIGASAQIIADLTDDERGVAAQSFTTSASAVTTPGTTTCGLLAIKNTHATATLLVYNDSGAASGDRVCTIPPGGCIAIPNPPSLWAKSSTGTVVAIVSAAKVTYH